MPSETTIAAIATPPGVGGVGVVRISGPKAKEVLKSLWKSPNVPVDNFASHRFYYGKIIDLSTEALLDKGMAVWMKSPNSYTGEDVVELNLHGSPIILEKIVGLCLQHGCQMAGPGEFTKRAYLNGKMDLAQAEAVADLISASSEEGLRLAKDHLAGRFSQRIHELQQELVRLRAFVEASIDFPEEDVALIQKEGALAKLAPIRAAITELLATYHQGQATREGLKTVIVGRPNAGKSSLLNTLLGKSRAIVHQDPGTTRDVIEETCRIDGYAFHLFDTAGIRRTNEAVEAIGVERAEALIEEAALVLWLVDGSANLQTDDFDFLCKLNLKKTIVCINKSDMDLVWDPKTLALNEGEEDWVKISAKTGAGLDVLQQRMVGWIKRLSPREGTSLAVSRLRHKEALASALQELTSGEENFTQESKVELLALHLQKAHEHLGSITGANISEDLLDKIFSEFCIGK